MKKGHRRAFGIVIGAVLAVVIGISLASTISGASDTKPAADKTASGGCGARTMMSTGGCSSTCSSSKKQAEVVMPEDVQMQSLDVEGGVDIVFTSADLAAVENFIRVRMGACPNNTSEKTCGLKSEIVTGEKAVTLSIRGEFPEGCCAGSFMDKAEDTCTDKNKDKDKNKVTKTT